MPLPRDLPSTTEAHVFALVQNKESESVYLDLKRELPGSDNASKHEFLADVSAFANSIGGDLIYGMQEDGEGSASSIQPLTGNPDDAVRRYQDQLLHNIEPRIHGVQLLAVPVESGFVMVVRVPQSWTGPHRVKTNQHFFIREGARKRQLDVPEIKSLFLRSEGQAQKVRDFRVERLGKILTNETPVRLMNAPRLVIHVVPTQAALGLMQIDPVPYFRRERQLPFIGQSTPSQLGLNLDGVWGDIPSALPEHLGYTLLFRQGFFESVWALHKLDGAKEPVLPDVLYESYVQQYVENIRRELRHHELSSELAVFISLLDANTVYLKGPTTRWHSKEYYRFDREQVLLPEAVIPAEVSAGRGLRPAFDLLCQAAGLESSANYDRNGEWVGRTIR